jgi:type II secretory pathway predicted ATPase ExeA
MYLSFYGLRKQPFHITPDPEFLYLSPSHQEALAAIIYGVEQRKGFVAITGAVGVGKTTILRSYLERKKESLKIIYVFNAKISFQELLTTIYRELGLPVGGDSEMEMVGKLYEFLIDEYKRGNNVVLVIDEAQNMPTDTLESLRMMSNLETVKDKLIQIVLVGQPEFEKELDTRQLRQLRQRLAVRATIQPLTGPESLEYVRFRLRRAGTDPSTVFTKPAFREIVRWSKGVPRLLNVLSDNALITGFGYQRRPVTRKIVREIVRDFEGERGHFFARKLTHRGATLILLLFFLGLTWLLPVKRILLDQTAMSVSRQRARETEAIKAVRPNPNGSSRARQEWEAPPRGEPEALSGSSEPAIVTKTVTRGDTLSQLVTDVYGFAQTDVQLRMRLEMVKQNNPQIKDIDRIVPGEKISFPSPVKEPFDVASDGEG